MIANTSITPANGVETVLLGETEAREQAAEIKQRGDDLKVRIWTWYSRKGWAALGYESFAVSAEPELGMVHQTAYSYVTGYEVEQTLLAAQNTPNDDSPRGENTPPPVTTIPLKHAKQLGRLKSSADQVEAHAKAWNLAITQGQEKPTEAEYKAAVDTVIRANAIKTYALIGNMVNMGVLSLDAGEEMCQQLEKVKPKIRGQVYELIARHKMTCPDLIVPIAGMLDRKPGEESKVLPEVVTGFLGGVSLKKATLSDLKRANYEAQQQYFADEKQAKRQANQPVEHIITVYENDPAATFKALARVLKAQDLATLQLLIQGQWL